MSRQLAAEGRGGNIPGSQITINGREFQCPTMTVREGSLIVLRTIAVILMTVIYSFAAVITGFLTRSDEAAARIMAHWGKILLRVSGCEVDVEFSARLPEGGAILVANHQSYLDIPLLQVALGAKARFVAKRELGRIPLFGKSIVSAGTLLIDRKDAREMIRWVREAARCVQRGNWLVVFPEGTRSDNGSIRKFQHGAFFVANKCGLPVFPVFVDGGSRAFPRGERFIRPARMTVRVLPPLPANGLSLEEMAQTARERILSAGANHSASPIACEAHHHPLKKGPILFFSRDGSIVEAKADLTGGK